MALSRQQIRQGSKQQIAPDCPECVINRTSGLVFKGQEAAPARLDCRQEDHAYALTGKTRDRYPTHRYFNIESLLAKSFGNPVGAHEVADSEEMLNVEENAPGCHGFVPHSASNSPTI